MKKTQTVTVKLDKVNLVKATSRNAIGTLPRAQRIDNKRKRDPKYKPNYLREE